MMKKPLSKHSNRVAIISGGFDPITAGHVDLFEATSKIADIVIVFANSDAWLTRKKGKPFMDQKHRIKILRSMSTVTKVFGLDDEDDADDSANKALEFTRNMYPYNHVMFVNGGDRTSDNIPEKEVARDLRVELVFGVGGDKDYSSSWLLNDWKETVEDRSWGHYRLLDTSAGFKVKELILEEGKSISLQKHDHRSEHWVIVEGEARVTLGEDTTYHDHNCHLYIPKNYKHKIENVGQGRLRLVEVQIGDYLEEEDITRYQE